MNDVKNHVINRYTGNVSLAKNFNLTKYEKFVDILSNYIWQTISKTLAFEFCLVVIL